MSCLKVQVINYGILIQLFFNFNRLPDDIMCKTDLLGKESDLSQQVEKIFDL